MNKTPVSILQEMMAKQQEIPKYDLIVDGGGPHINTFVYEVSCDGLSAIGGGSSKKDAKHEAANAMLKIIAAQRSYPQLPASPAATPLPKKVPELPSELFVNAVGHLQTLCNNKNLGPPEYELISDIGPPHAKVFTTQCKVATFVEIGIAKSKKQAKQEAAKRMFDKLAVLVPDLAEVETNDDGTESCHEIAKARHLVPARLPGKIGMDVKVSNYHAQFKESLEPNVQEDLIEKLTTLLEEKETATPTATDLYELTTKLKDILAPVNIEMSVLVLPSKGDASIVAMRVSRYPSIVQITVDGNKLLAGFRVLIETIKAMILFLK